MRKLSGIRSGVAWLLITAFLSLGIVALPATEQLPKGVTKVTRVEGIAEYRLDNGLRVLLFPDQRMRF